MRSQTLTDKKSKGTEDDEDLIQTNSDIKENDTSDGLSSGDANKDLMFIVSRQRTASLTESKKPFELSFRSPA